MLILLLLACAPAPFLPMTSLRPGDYEVIEEFGNLGRVGGLRLKAGGIVQSWSAGLARHVNTGRWSFQHGRLEYDWHGVKWDLRLGDDGRWHGSCVVPVAGRPDRPMPSIQQWNRSFFRGGIP